MKHRLAAVAALALVAVAPAAHASIVFVAPTAATPGSMTITAPISFTLIADFAAGTTLYFDLQNWVAASDGVITEARFSRFSLSRSTADPRSMGAEESVPSTTTISAAWGRRTA